MKRLLIALVFLLSIGSIAHTLSVNATHNSLWVNQQGLNVEIGDQASAPAEIAGQPCFQTTFKIKRFAASGTQNGQTLWKPAPDQAAQVCAVQSGIGLLAYHSGGTYIQFPGSAHAIRVHSTASNFIVTVIPVPGSRTTIVQTKTSTSYSPAATHIFYNLLGVGEVNISAGEAVYYLRHWPERFVDQSGSTLDMSNFAFSSNGEWMMTIVRSAVMRINVKTKEMQTIARGFVDGGIQYRMSVTNDGRYAFVQSYHQGFGNPVMHDLSDCQPNQQYNYGQVPQVVSGCGVRQLRNDIVSKVSGFLLFEQMKFGYDSQTLSGFVSYREQPGASVIKKRVTISRNGYVKSSLEYLALGDSFSSGEGDTEGSTWYEPGTDTNNNKCHLSRRSYPYLVAEQLGLHEGPNKTPANNSFFRSVACSGAVSLDIININVDYKGQVRDGKTRQERDVSFILKEYSTGEVGQIEFVNAYKPKLITVSIIGNDIGFSGKLRRCLGPDTCFNSYEERLEILQEIQGKFNDLVNLYETIKEISPGVRIYALGYPELIYPPGQCALNVHLNSVEGQMANDLVQFLNATIEAAARKAGVFYVNVENAFSGRRLCENRTQFLAVNGLTAGNDLLLRTIGNESYHPNPIGHQRLAERVVRQTNALAGTMPTPSAHAIAPDPFGDKYAGFFENFTRRERQIYSTINDDKLAEDIVVPLLRQQSKVEALGGGEYSLWINSEPVYLGSFLPDDNGLLHLDYIIPENIKPGFHTLHLYGKNAGGVAVDIYKTVFVAANDNDYDGDGVPNDRDSCPLLLPTGIDEDKDGIDDACDNFISNPPLPTLVIPPGGENPKPIPHNPETVAGNRQVTLSDQTVRNASYVEDRQDASGTNRLSTANQPGQENTVLALSSPYQDINQPKSPLQLSDHPSNKSSLGRKFAALLALTTAVLTLIVVIIFLKHRNTAFR